MTILEAVRDSALFGGFFRDRDSWRAWEAFLAALFGLPLTDEQLAIYRRHTGRTRPPDTPAREVYCIAGRRAGKSRIAALLAIYAAAFRDYRTVLAPGEKATVAVIAADRQQARVCFRYVSAMIDAVPMLAALVDRQTVNTIELRGNVVIEVATCSHRTTRGYSFAAVIADELAFWRDETSASPDIEVLNAVRPGLATIPGSMLICISSPYGRSGALWTAYREHFGRDGDSILIWQSDSLSMNPTIDRAVIDAAYEADEAAATAEYGGQFRRDIEGFISREAVEAVVVPGRRELPPVPGIRYGGFCDPSGGSRDSMTLAIAHNEDGRAVLDALRERRPPFSPESVVQEFAGLLKAYGVTTVTGDRYAGEWPRERFREHGISYQTADKSKSDLYRDALPLLNSGRVELLDLPRLHAQLLGLERRTSRAGRDSIDHGPGGHDDIANAVAGALWKCERVSTGPSMAEVRVRTIRVGRQQEPPAEPSPREPGRVRVRSETFEPWW